MDMKTDFALLHATLHHSSDCARILSPEEHDHAFSLCDGYGRMSLDQLRELDLTWDWSHVRDSSDDAVAEAATYVRACLAKRPEMDRIRAEAKAGALFQTYPISWES